jgi:hypothetical protein
VGVAVDRVLTKDDMQRKLRSMKRQYDVFQSMKNRRGFRWCPLTGVPVASEHA